MIFFNTNFLKLNKYLGAYPVYNFYKTIWLLDPRWLLCISHGIGGFSAIKDLQDNSPDLLEEFQIDVNYHYDSLNSVNIPTFWNRNKSLFPILEQIVNKVANGWLLLTYKCWIFIFSV